MNTQELRESRDAAWHDLLAVEARMRLLRAELAVLDDLRRRFFPPRRAELLRMRREGLSLASIGRHFMISKQRVHQILTRDRP